MTLTQILELGGPCGDVIIAVGIVALCLALYSFFYTSIVWHQFKRTFLEKKQASDRCLRDYTGSNPFLIIILDVVGTHANHSDDLRAEIGYLFYRNFRRVSSFISMIKLVSVVSPLLGLLGTVIGMLEVFQVIAENGTPQSNQLATGIWQALVTTVMGLCVAIPALVIFYLLSLRMKVFHIETIEHCYRALDTVKRVQQHEKCKV